MILQNQVQAVRRSRDCRRFSNVLDFPGGSDGKASACNAGDLGLSNGREDALEKEMATHSSIRAWRIPWTEEPGRHSPWSRIESDTTELLHFTSLNSRIPKSGCLDGHSEERNSPEENH